MKKSLVLTSILFSSMALGSVVVTPGTIQAVADVSVSDKDNNIENTIIYKDKHGLEIDKVKIYAPVNGTYALNKLKIPAGYKLSKDNKNITVTVGGEHIVNI